jgi:RNA polymerase sigma factor (sigma-70 family)
MQIKYIFDPEFLDTDKRDFLINYDVYTQPDAIHKSLSAYNSESDSYFIDLTQYGVLSKSAESTLFKKYNCLKYMYAHTDSQEYLIEAIKTRNLLINHNLKLAKKTINRLCTNDNDIEEKTSDACIWLMSAVESYDAGRGYKFSTYLVNTIYLNNGRRRPKSYSQVSLDQCDDLKTTDDPAEITSKQEIRRYIREVLITTLNKRDLAVIMHRYGIDTEPKKLREVGDILKISRETVRQIQAGVLRKLLKEIQKRRTDGQSL